MCDGGRDISEGVRYVNLNSEFIICCVLLSQFLYWPSLCIAMTNACHARFLGELNEIISGKCQHRAQHLQALDK